MIPSKDLIKNIKSEFPRLRNSKDYADLILEGVKLKALNSGSSKKRRDFLKSGKVKEHVFSRSYMKLNLLIPIRNADRITVLASARAGLFFDYKSAGRVLNLEKNLLFSHFDSDPSIRKHVAKPLKLAATATSYTIKNIMNSGDLMKQAGIYDQVFSNLIKNHVRPKGYMWFGVRTIPVSHYYLSDKSKQLLIKR